MDMYNHGVNVGQSLKSGAIWLAMTVFFGVMLFFENQVSPIEERNRPEQLLSTR